MAAVGVGDGSVAVADGVADTVVVAAGTATVGADEADGRRAVGVGGAGCKVDSWSGTGGGNVGSAD